MTPCIANPSPFDVLVDHASGPAHRAAVAEAQTLCNACPIRDRCLLVDNAAEPWAQAITGRKLAPTIRAGCGNSWGYKQHTANGETPCEKCRAYGRENKRRSDAKRRAKRGAA